MTIATGDLDPQVLQTLLAGLNASLSSPNPSAEELRVQFATRGRYRPDFRPLRNWVAGGLLLASMGAASLFSFGFDTGSAIGAAIGAWNGIFWGCFAVGMVQSHRSTRREANIIHADLFTKWIPHLNLSPAERAYCETVALLAKTETQIDEKTGSQILSDLNALMRQSRRLDDQRAEIERVAGAESISALQAERNRIAERAGSTVDAQARSDLNESLQMCESRLENARQMTPTLERLEAQQERIVQTLASIQSRLARLETAPSTVTLPDAEEVQQTLRHLTNQTRAVEDAVQEVMAVSSQ